MFPKGIFHLFKNLSTFQIKTTKFLAIDDVTTIGITLPNFQKVTPEWRQHSNGSFSGLSTGIKIVYFCSKVSNLTE